MEEAMKRKREEEVVVGLPVEVWASILSEYSSHQDLRNCISVNRFFWQRIPPLIDRLYVFHAPELHTGYASKFPNVKCAYIYSLTSWPHDQEGPEMMSLCLDTARSAVRFLECFPNLRFAHLGGYTPGNHDFIKLALDRTHNDLSYFESYCRTEGHQAAFREMLEDFCNAFERGSLSNTNLELSGIFDAPFDNTQLDCSPNNRCQLCPRIVQTFRLGLVAGLGSPDICMPKQEQLRCVCQRDPDFLKSSNILAAMLGRTFLGTIRLEEPPVKKGSVVYVADKMVMAIELGDCDLDTIDFLCGDCGCDASTVSPEFVLKCLTRLYESYVFFNRDGRHYIKRELVNRLSGMGFQLRESDYTIVVPKGRASSSHGQCWIVESMNAN